MAMLFSSRKKEAPNVDQLLAQAAELGLNMDEQLLKKGRQLCVNVPDRVIAPITPLAAEFNRLAKGQQATDRMPPKLK
jgi:hypothetical protein